MVAQHRSPGELHREPDRTTPVSTPPNLCGGVAGDLVHEDRPSEAAPAGGAVHARRNRAVVADKDNLDGNAEALRGQTRTQEYFRSRKWTGRRAPRRPYAAIVPERARPRGQS